jgi:phosphoribosyl-ATP pyrophosphohydrolase
VCVHFNVHKEVISEVADLVFMIVTFMFRELLLLSAAVKYFQ